MIGPHACYTPLHLSLLHVHVVEFFEEGGNVSSSSLTRGDVMLAEINPIDGISFIHSYLKYNFHVLGLACYLERI